MALLRLTWSLKIVTAPLIDAFFIRKFGKRKTYIVPLSFILSVALFISSFRIDGDIKSNNIQALFV